MWSTPDYQQNPMFLPWPMATFCWILWKLVEYFWKILLINKQINTGESITLLDGGNKLLLTQLAAVFFQNQKFNSLDDLATHS